MVSDKNGWANSVEVFVRIFDLEGNASRQGHGILESASGGPLGYLLAAEDSQYYRGDGTIDGAYYEGDVGGERTSDKGRLGHDGGKHVEGHDKPSIARQKVGQIRSKRHVIEPWEIRGTEDDDDDKDEDPGLEMLVERSKLSTFFVVRCREDVFSWGSST